MASNSLHLFVIILAFSFLISLPTSKTARLLVHNNQAISSTEDASEVNKEETMKMVDGEFFYRRMDLGINKDYYPGSGANNRHTPNPPVKE